MGGLTAALAAAAAVSTLAAILLLRDNTRLERVAQHALDETERLRDDLWRVADSEERHRSLVEAQGDLIVRLGQGGHVLFANEAYRALFGDDPTIGQTGTCSRIVASQSGEMREDGTRTIDEEVLLADGSTRWISWIETTVRDEAGASVLQRVGRDISVRISAQSALREAHLRAEEASEAKSRLIATVSHEFRTPLNGILGMSELLSDTALDAEQRAYVGALKASGEALLNQVEDILDFAKVEAGRIDLANEPFDLVRVTEDVVELIAPRAQEKGLDIAAAIAVRRDARHVGDAEKLRQILVNLVGNAVKFTQAGHVCVRLEERDDAIRITVEDSGPGIAPDRLEAIFTEFEQADAEVGRLHGGTGLGLPIARRLAQAMGGDITVTSRPSAGSRFCVDLPLPAFTVDSPGETGNWIDQSILLIGAGAAFAEAITVRAEAGGGRCRSVSAAEAAAELGRGGHTALVVDHSVGTEIARALAELALRCGVTRRFIALTPLDRRAFGPPSDAGFTGFVVKPARSRTLDVRLGGQSAAEVEEETRGQFPPQQRLARRIRVLVAEDNDINALLLQRHIEKAGSEAVRVRDGREALGLLEAALAGDAPPFDVALFDVRMPNLDGLSAVRLYRIAERNAGTGQRMPIIAISANVSEADRSAALSAGMDDCLGKPVDRSRLIGLLARSGSAAPATLSA